VIYSTKNRYGKLYNIELRLGHNGFDLDNPRINDGTAPAPQDPRKVRWQEDLRKVLALAEPIKQTDVTNAVDGNIQRGYLLIKQLIREGKIIKDGRGEDAVYKLTDAGKASLAETGEDAEGAGEDAGNAPAEENVG
ncbi:hypothetical protein EB093_09005, partial [bacterium]|nr:hypothetical protein [bacterium]